MGYWVEQFMDVSNGQGYTIAWQSEPGGYGATVEQILIVAQDRLRVFEAGALPCKENAEAIEHIKKAVRCLFARTKAREEQGVEGTMKPHQP